MDEENNFVSVDGERRVKDILIQDDNGDYVPIDAEAVYIVASHNYLLRDGGSNYTKFMDNNFLIQEGISDYQVLTQYIRDVLQGNLSEAYSEPQGRITVK